MSREASIGRAALALGRRHPVPIGFVALAAVAAVVRVGYYPAPLVGDVGQFLYVGDVVGHGGTPYVDAAYSKGPLTALLFALVEPVAGDSTTVVRLTLVPFAAAAALALAGYVARYAGRPAGAVAGLVYAACSALGNLEGSEGKTEAYGVAPAFGALWCATRAGPAGPAAAGALVACAMLINPALGVVIPAIAVELWLGAARGGRARRLAVAAAGGAIPLLLAVAWLAPAGALDDMFTQVGGQVADSVNPGNEPGVLHIGSNRASVPLPTLWALAAIGCALAARERRLRRPALVLALVMVAVFARVKLSSYEFSYQYYPALPAMFGAMVLGAASVWGRGLVARAAVVLALALPLGRVVHQQLDLLGEPAAARSPNGAQVYPVARFVRSHTTRGDRIIVEGGRAEVYWVAKRRAPTRFFDGFGLNGDASYPSERRRDLARHPPAAVVKMNTDPLSLDLWRVIATGRYVRAYARGGNFVWLRPAS